jgi:hypothetical protein
MSKPKILIQLDSDPHPSVFDAVVAKDLFVRLGRVAETKLDDPQRAVTAYAKAVDES